MVIRRIGGVISLGLAFVFVREAVQNATQESLLAEDGTGLSHLIMAFVPVVLAVAAGLWMLTSKPARSSASAFMGQAGGEAALVHTTQAAAPAPRHVVDSVSEEWHACSQCGQTVVNNVESTSTCTCGQRSKVGGNIQAWPPCEKCGATDRHTNALVGRCSGCGAVRRTALV